MRCGFFAIPITMNSTQAVNDKNACGEFIVHRPVKLDSLALYYNLSSLIIIQGDFGHIALTLCASSSIQYNSTFFCVWHALRESECYKVQVLLSIMFASNFKQKLFQSVLFKGTFPS